MQHEKVFVRKNGDNVIISVELLIIGASGVSAFKYTACVRKRLKGKLKWFNVHNSDDYSFRKLSIAERREYIEKVNLQHVSAEEILEVKTELWNLIKPTI